ncbi:MAG: energy-coupling factor transporter transmembrane protein EcfT [Gemmatimonadaceae bacterium]
MIGDTPRFLNYEPGDSILHRLDPRTKLLAAIAVVADALVASVPGGMIVAYLLGALIGVAAYHALPQLWRVLRPLLVLIALFGCLIVVTTPGKALAHFWIIVPTRDGIDLAIRIGLQSLLIIYTTSLMSLTTPPMSVASALHWTFGWMERLKIPIGSIIAMVAIGLTFVPLLIDETQKVIAAQRARGADLGMNAFLDEQAMGALLIPLLLANLRRGSELAESMEARLYDTGPRTSMAEPHFKRLDAVAGGAIIVVSAAVVGLSFLL